MEVNPELQFEIKRNEKGNLFGNNQCSICKKSYTFEENENADVIAIGLEYVPINNQNKLFVRLNVISKCPNCGYKTTHYQIEQNDKLE